MKIFRWHVTDFIVLYQRAKVNMKGILLGPNKIESSYKHESCQQI